MRKATLDKDIFRYRREKLASQIGDGVLLLAGNKEKNRNHDVNYPFRQSSNFWYLTGFDEPDSILIFRPGRTPESIMYVREKNEAAETWDGFRFGPEGVCSEFGIDKGHTLAEFDSTVVEYMKGADRIFYQYGLDADLDRQLPDLLEKINRSGGRSGTGLRPVFDAGALIGEQRLFKTEYEVSEMKKAADISSEAHLNMMKFTKPGVNERQVEAIFHMTTMLAGAKTFAYPSIVAAGNNATTLHYGFNDQPCEEGDLLLIDAGCEVNHYAADITRTFPVSGQFTEPQKRLYQAVLDVQKELVDMVKPGVEFQHLKDQCVEKLLDVMMDLRLLTGRREDMLESAEYKRFYPHGVGHWLGLDVHDSGAYEKDGKPRYLEPGMAFTIEPGIYVPATDTSAPEEFRGMGIRIEDNIVVTAIGRDVLTDGVPKEISEIEAVVGTGVVLPNIKSSLY